MREVDLNFLVDLVRKQDPSLSRKAILTKILALEELKKLAHSYVMPAYIASSSRGMITDGATATLILRDMPMVVINHHVLDQYRLRREANKEVAFYLNTVEIPNPEERVVSSSGTHDLVTLFLSEAELRATRKVAPREVYWSKIGGDSKVLIVAGYPQVFRSQAGSKIKQGGVSIGEFAIENSSPKRVILSCDRRQWIRGSGDRDLWSVENWGGLSGSGVFVFDSGQPLVPLRLAGVVTELMRLDADSLTIAASSAELINDQGAIQE
jgi:hypothetical protein